MTTPATPRSTPASSRVSAIVALVIGAVLTISGPVIGVLVGSFALVPTAVNFGESTIRVDPSRSLHLESGEEVTLLAPVSDLEHADPEMCTASTPNGSAATITYEPASTLNTLVGGTRYESFARVTATADGQQAITCQTDIDVVAAPPFQLSELFGPLVWWTAGGFIVSLLGVALAIVGLVRLTRTRSRM